MTKFKSKAQRKAVMRLVKQDKMNMKHAKKGKSESMVLSLQIQHLYLAI